MAYKKQRGQKRKLRQMKYYLEKYATAFPENHNQEMEHWHVPGSEEFINSPKTSSKIKTQVMQYLIDNAEYLRSIKPEWAKDAKLFCMISYPNLWDSQILLFFIPENNKYYHNFLTEIAKNKL